MSNFADDYDDRPRFGHRPVISELCNNNSSNNPRQNLSISRRALIFVGLRCGGMIALAMVGHHSTIGDMPQPLRFLVTLGMITAWFSVLLVIE